MKGIPLSCFKESLSELPETENLFPLSVRDKLIEMPGVHDNPYIMDMMYDEKGWKEFVKDFSSWQLTTYFSFQELIQIWFFDSYFFPNQTERGLRAIPAFRMMEKIKSSFWRWGYNNDETTWNTAVRIYHQLSNLEVVEKDFRVTLDWTTGWNQRGYSESSRTYLDGVFAALLHYKSEHVMTIGFSFTDKGELLLQQVQLFNKKGNRFLYKLSSDHMMWAVDFIKRNFPGRIIYIVEGESLADSIYQQYYSVAKRSREEFSRIRSQLWPGIKKQHLDSIMESLKYHREQYKAVWPKAVEFKDRTAKHIVSVYSRIPSGNECLVRNNLKFRLLYKPA